MEGNLRLIINHYIFEEMAQVLENLCNGNTKTVSFPDKRTEKNQ